ncbi:MAG: penicillin acylase family protein [Acidobacteriota bacterium]
MASTIPLPPRPKRHWFRRFVLLLFGIVIVVSAFAFWRLRAPLPTVSGTERVDGLRAKVEIIRDVDGVPHIRASSEADALYALGYVHAQERLWQMEFQRRVAQGRLSEFAGPETLRADRLLRTVGLARAAQTAWHKLDAGTRALIEAYVAGINGFLATHRGGGLPVEFALLRVSPEPWRGEDVLAWHKAMAWSLSQNWSQELLRVRLSARIGDEAANELMPAYTRNGPIVLPPDAQRGPARTLPVPVQPMTPEPRPPAPGADAKGPALLADLEGLAELAASLPYGPVPGGGSNNWVVSGVRSVTGRPLLANDPHLAGQAPAVWYLAHITGGGLDVIGASLPGTPGILVGHNRHIAWGITAMLADVQDLYVERVNARDQVEYNGAWEQMTIVREVIKVRGEDDVPIRIRVTRHGPIISDALEKPQAALALRWTGLDEDDPTARAFLGVNLASTWAEFVTALAPVHVPTLNFVYADVEGNIGYIGPGAFPVRLNHDGSRPLPGWTSEYDWRGYLHESEWPTSLNPGRGFIVSANNKAVPDSYSFNLGTSWEAPYRAARIIEMLEGSSRLAVEDMARMQRDVRSAQARTVLPFLLRARPLDAASRDGMDRLQEWDGTLSGDSPEAALYEAWYEATVRGLFEDDLGSDLFAEYAPVRYVVAKAVDAIAQAGTTAWCDDVRTPEPETCDTLLGQTLRQAIADMGERQGTANISRWRWDAVNAAQFPHDPFDTVPALRWAFSRTVPRGGDGFTVTPVMPLHNRIFVSSYRQVIDLAALDASRFVIPMGQSGHVWSRRYADLLEKWDKVEYLPMRFTADAVDAALAERLVLEPN